MARCAKITFFILPLLILLSGAPAVNSAEQKLNIVVTILPQAEFVEKVGGDWVSISVMVPPGANPHTYEPTPLQLKKVESATAKGYKRLAFKI